MGCNAVLRLRYNSSLNGETDGEGSAPAWHPTREHAIFMILLAGGLTRSFRLVRTDGGGLPLNGAFPGSRFIASCINTSRSRLQRMWSFRTAAIL